MIFYDRSGVPLDGDDIALWTDLMANTNRRVALTKITGGNPPEVWSVSTVHLGLDHSYGDGPPLIFESMIFDADGIGNEQDRYSTEEQAREGHSAMVAEVVSRLSGAIVLHIDPEDASTVSRETE